MLSEVEKNYRIGKFTGSLANSVMGATTEAELVRIWRIKVGLDDPEPVTYAMRAGSHMEPLILNERELQTGHAITRRGNIVDHPSVADVCVKLDGFREHDDAVIEAKFISPHRKREEIYRSYYPQVILQMLCTGAKAGVLAIAQGTNEPTEFSIEYNAAYADQLMERAVAFLMCMKAMIPPCPLPEVVPPTKWRIVDLSIERPNWADEFLAFLSQYDATASYAAINDEAGAAVRALVPDDVAQVIAGKYVINRNKRGVVSITSPSQRHAA
jgi:hypothetical protein